MELAIKNQPISKTLFGATLKHHASKTYGEELISLLDHVWLAVKELHIKHGGVSYALYGKDNELFGGVELLSPLRPQPDYVIKKIDVKSYALWKHFGSYKGLPDAHANVRRILGNMKIRHYQPVIEIYGHWNPDESKLETDLIYPIT